MFKSKTYLKNTPETIDALKNQLIDIQKNISSKVESPENSREGEKGKDTQSIIEHLLSNKHLGSPSQQSGSNIVDTEESAEDIIPESR